MNPATSAGGAHSPREEEHNEQGYAGIQVGEVSQTGFNNLLKPVLRACEDLNQKKVRIGYALVVVAHDANNTGATLQAISTNQPCLAHITR